MGRVENYINIKEVQRVKKQELDSSRLGANQPECRMYALVFHQVVSRPPSFLLNYGSNKRPIERAVQVFKEDRWQKPFEGVVRLVQRSFCAFY